MISKVLLKILWKSLITLGIFENFSHSVSKPFKANCKVCNNFYVTQQTPDSKCHVLLSTMLSST